MKTIKTLCVALLAAVALPTAAQEAPNITDEAAASTDTIDYSPTMGWSSWNTFGVDISESIIKSIANNMVSKGLLGVGYNHVNIDDGYFGGRDKETGKLKIHPTRFPHGMQPVVDHIHSKGLKAGIYSDGGYNTCGSMFNGDVIGKGVGLYKHDQQDCDMFFNELGFDFIKVDFCGGSYYHNEDHLVLDEKERYTAIAQAIKNTGRKDVRMNICRWDYPGTWANNAGFSWRTTGDIDPSWKRVKEIIAENLFMSAYSSKGHYNDMDMLEVGVEKWGSKLTSEENKTHFGIWCIMNSPLLIGCDIRSITTTNLNLLKNKDLIALNKDTLYQQAYLAQKTSNGCYIIVKDLEKRYGNKRAFAIYNPNDASKTVTMNFSDIDLADSVALHDCFTNKDLTEKYYDTYKVSVPAHGTKIYVAEAQTRLERVRYEAETGYSKAYSELSLNNTCTYSEASYCSGGYKAGWLGGNKTGNYLEWRNVYSQEGGDYKLTIGYICGTSRSMTVSVNGKNVKTLSCNSGGWEKVSTKTLDITLKPGNNVIRLSNTSSDMPDLDYIDVVNKNLTAVKPITTQTASPTTATYDLSGRKTSNAKGVVISNGKKYIKH